MTAVGQRGHPAGRGASYRAMSRGGADHDSVLIVNSNGSAEILL